MVLEMQYNGEKIQPFRFSELVQDFLARFNNGRPPPNWVR